MAKEVEGLDISSDADDCQPEIRALRLRPAGALRIEICSRVTCITSSECVAWHSLFLTVNRLSHDEKIRLLKAQLHHFDHSPDFGDGETVRAIREHLLLRIREAEGAMRCPAWLLAETKAGRRQFLHSEAA